MGLRRREREPNATDWHLDAGRPQGSEQRADARLLLTIPAVALDQQPPRPPARAGAQPLTRHLPSQPASPASPPARARRWRRSPTDTPAASLERWTAGQDLVAACVRVLLWVAVLSGPAGLLVALGARTPVPPAVVSSASVREDTAARLVASEAATQWVSTWLTADANHQSRIAAWYAGHVDLPSRGARVDRPSAVAATEVARGVWSVVVAANVQEAAEAAASSGPATASTAADGNTAASADSSSWPRRYYQALVLTDASSAAQLQGWTSPTARVLTVPALVPGPVAAVTPVQLGYETVVAPSTRMGRAVQVFLAAYLAGQGDVAPLLTPGSPLTAVKPSPATRVELTDLRLPTGDDRAVAEALPVDGTHVQAALTADLYTPAGPPRSSQMLLTLTARAGRWEITGLDPHPVIAGAQPLASGASATSTPPATPGPASATPHP